MKIMKSEINNYRSVFLVIILFLASFQIKIFAQDTLKQSKNLTDAKIQLLEYKQKILETRLDLLETPSLSKGMDNRKNRNSPISLMGNHKPDKIIDTLKGKPFNQAITFCLNRIFEGTLQLSYEKAIKRNLSLDVSLLGTYVTKDGIGGGYLQNQQLAYADAATDSYIYYSGSMIRSIGGIVRLKNYLLTRVSSDSKAPIGLYAAPQLMYRRVWISGNTYGYDFYQGSLQKEITRNLDVIQGGVILGSKFVVAKVLCLDVYMGGVMRLSKYYNEPTFTKYKRWNNIDYSGILPTAGINIGILK